jgi:hypothetical protein
MLLRPLAAQWFEVTVPKADADDTMEALARHAEVQFEWPADPEAPAHLERLREFVTRYRDLAFRFARFWPPPTYTKRCCDLPLETEARIAVNRIEHCSTPSARRWRNTTGYGLNKPKQTTGSPS